ncbi:MAG: DUF1698 domain-containing protein [Spirochaetia bacterium]|nr:DUF1698 domain-containing protein [Spirochaetia bacterium]
MTDEEFAEILSFAEHHPVSDHDFSGDEIILGNEADLSDSEHRILDSCLRKLTPWRKGPFRIYGHRIDANWQSHLKWNRVVSFADSMEHKKIADVGCNNGYYMYRMQHFNPEYILGLDPVITFQRKHAFFKTLIDFPSMVFRQKGFEDLESYENEFDLVFSMGILYHHTDPMQILRLMYSSLKKGGQAVIETLGFLPDQPDTVLLSKEMKEDIFNRQIHTEKKAQEFLKKEVSLIPKKRYAGMKSVWNVPSPGAVKNWIARAGFHEVYLQNIHRYDGEQLCTEWCGMPGLSEMLGPDRNFTIEGYPAPVRIYFSARK